MKAVLVAITLIGAAAALPIKAQTPKPAPVEPTSDAPPAYQLHRFDEDYRYLADPAKRTDGWDPIKFISLDPDQTSYLSIGGEIRERFERIDNPDFRVGGAPARNDYLLNRAQLHADLHLGSNVRIFGQIGSYSAVSADAPLGPAQQNDVELAQLFVETRIEIGGPGSSVALRAGRQELSFGKFRLVSSREGPNVRFSFDGLRLFWQAGGKNDTVRVDAFVTRPVLNRGGSFDDQPNPAQLFWGVYGNAPLGARASDLNIDVYYLGFSRERARFADGDGRERRHTIGVRLFGESAGWDWDIEAARQFGSLGTANIKADTLAAVVGRTFGDLPWTPRLGVTANLATGDPRPGDGTLGTFNPFFPSLPYYSEAALIFPANIMDVKPELSVKPTDDFDLSFAWDFLWRHRAADAFYAPPLVPLKGTSGAGRSIGHQAQLRAAWAVSRHVQVLAAYVHFSAGETLQRVGARNVDFFLLSAAYRF